MLTKVKITRQHQKTGLAVMVVVVVAVVFVGDVVVSWGLALVAKQTKQKIPTPTTTTRK